MLIICRAVVSPRGTFFLYLHFYTTICFVETYHCKAYVFGHPCPIFYLEKVFPRGKFLSLEFFTTRLFG
jgi:hypothetical protein